MSEHWIDERLKKELLEYCNEVDFDQISLKPVHFKLSLVDRVLSLLGQGMINLGLKLKDRPYNRLDAEQAQTPNFMIIL